MGNYEIRGGEVVPKVLTKEEILEILVKNTSITLEAAEQVLKYLYENEISAKINTVDQNFINLDGKSETRKVMYFNKINCYSWD